MENTVIKIGGMSCQGCVKNVTGVLQALPGVTGVHDLHVWRIGGGRVALSAHLIIHHHDSWPALLARLNHLLKTRYGIEHTTLQPVWFAPPSGHIIPIHQIRH